MWGKIVILALLAVPLSLPLPAWATRKHKDTPPPAALYMDVPVVRVIDGDTFVVKDVYGMEQHVRFVDINTPELAHDGNPEEPFARDARARVQQLALGKTVKLVIARKGHDKYGRILADVYLPNGDWLNYQLVDEGLAHVYTFADDAMHPDALLKAEQEARVARRGLWSNPRWAVKDAATCCAAAYIGIFQVVQGKVLSTGQGMKEIYLNFGPDYHTDFTVVIEKKNLKNFKAAGIDPLTAYAGHVLRMHGFTDPVEGVEMRVTHPAQIEVLN
jgi:endonuclease YncB( thermonuclease family)